MFKRKFYILAALLLVTANCLADANIAIGSANAMRGQDVTVAVTMQGDFTTSAWQTDIMLPDGITVTDITAEGANATTDRHNSYAIQSMGATRLLSYSTEGAPMNSDNAIALLTLHVSSQCTPGTYTIPLNNTVMATPSEQAYYPSNSESFTITVSRPLLGDVNNDGEVDVIDAIALNGYYLNNSTSTQDPAICDVNKDGDIDVADVIAIISIYLNGK